MSQTNEFAKAILPDYVYFDLQTSNVHNNNTGTTPQLRFEESRDAPIIENAGEYNMSVTRFSVDTATLPVLVVEPDLNDAGFDPHKTIHRVAVITESASLKVENAGATITTITDDFANSVAISDSKFSASVSASADGEVIVLGERNFTDNQFFDTIDNRGFATQVFATGRGRVIVGVRNSAGKYALSDITAHGLFVQSAIGFPNPTNLTSGTIAVNWEVGQNVAISGDGNIIFIGSNGNCPFYWIFNRLTNVFCRHDKSQFSTKPSRVVGALNTTGSLYIVGYPDKTTSNLYVGGYDIMAFDGAVSTSRISVIGSVGTDTHQGHAVAMNGVGNIAVATKSITGNGGAFNVTQSFASPHFVSSFATYPTQTSNFANFGLSISINDAGTLIAVGSSSGTTGNVSLYGYASGVYSVPAGNVITVSTPVGNDVFTGAIGFGYSNSLSYDGNTIHIGLPNFNTNTGAVQTFHYNGASWDFKSLTKGVSTGSYYGISVSSFHDGIEYVAGVESPTNVGTKAVKVDIITNETLPPALRNNASIANVFWMPDNTSLTPPNRSELDGINTATFAYYYCHSYNNFIDKVNDAIKDAYVANFNKLWIEWINILGVANADFIKAEFINIVARCFSTPPYMEWNSTLDANMYLNTLFSVANNYYYPARTYAPSGANPNTQVSTVGQAQPLNLRIAFNASLYSLFAGFPATETIIDGERFYMLNMPKQVASLLDNTTIPLRALPLMPHYPFLYPYHNNTTKVFTLPFPTNSISTYPLQEFFIQLRQEISTIDAWCPISSIVFTSNQLPIIVSQFSSTNTIGNNPISASIGNRFALVITDLMTNQQGYRPNLIYNPTAEYRRVSLTGNMGIRDIDINVFWRPKTGQLLPFRLQSGGSASLKLLFEKKNKNPEKIIEPPINEDIFGGRMPRSRR